MLFYFPFYQAAVSNKKLGNILNPAYRIGLFFFKPYFLSFSGPLIPPLVLLICSLSLLFCFYYYFKKTAFGPVYFRIKTAINHIPKDLFILLSFFHFTLLLFILYRDL